MKKKGLIGILIVLFFISSVFVLAQEECGFWCKLGGFLWGTGEGEKTLVGKAGGIWGEAVEI